MLVVALLVLTLLPTAAGAREIPVRDFFKLSEFQEVKLSPTGEYLAVSVPQDDRTLLAVLRIKDRAIVSKWDYGPNMHVVGVDWVNDTRFLVRVAQKQGSFDYLVGNPDLFAANADGSQRVKLDFGGTYSVVDLLRDDDRNILVQRTIERPNLFRMDVYTGRLSKIAASPVESGGFAIDLEGKVRYAIGSTDKQKLQTWRREGGEWKLVSEADSLSGGSQLPEGFTADNKKVYIWESKDGEPASLFLLDPESGKKDLVYPGGVAEAERTIWSADGRRLLGVAFEPDLPGKKYFDQKDPETRLLAGLDMAFAGSAVNITSRTKDGRYLLAWVYSDVDPGRAYLVDASTGKATFLLAGRSWIEPQEMAKMKPVTVRARDGLELRGYLTLPPGSDGRNLPLVVNPHGGPHGPRDRWRFNPEVQFLANRGYAVLQMNYRGSGGYGRTFQSAGYRRWATDMQNDLTDSVRWTITQGIVDPKRVCIYGASYGGYAALMSVVREPDLYKCTIGYVGVYSLPMMFKKGDIPEEESGRTFLQRVLPATLAEQQAQSPAYNADKIKVPVMLVAGRKDQRVPIGQMDFMISQMAKVGKKPEVVIVEDKEAHGFYDVDNNVNLYTQMQAFLDKYIGKDAAGSK